MNDQELLFPVTIAVINSSKHKINSPLMIV